MFLLMALMMAFPFSIGALAKEVKTQPTSYRTVIEIEDWGAAITKAIVDVGRPIPKDSVTTDTFNVHVVRSDNRLKTPFLEAGYRTVTDRKSVV